MITQEQAFVQTQIEAIHRHLRFLEIVATSPIGLTTDLKSLRESIPVQTATEERDRQAFREISRNRKKALEAGLRSVSLIEGLIQTLKDISKYDQRLSPEWENRMNKVLKRIQNRLGSQARSETVQKLEGVYVIIEPGNENGRPFLETAEAVIEAGAAAIQLRDKRGNEAMMLQDAKELASLSKKTNTPFIINDRPDVARLADADGVHLGQNDLPISEARLLLKPHQIIGTSNATIQEALNSEAETADYVAIGSIFETRSKTDTRSAGLETLKKVGDLVKTPVVAIGGINPNNAKHAIDAGAHAICVLSVVRNSNDPTATVEALDALFQME